MVEICRNEGVVWQSSFVDASSAVEACLPGDILALPPGVHTVDDLGELEEGGGMVVGVTDGGDAEEVQLVCLYKQLKEESSGEVRTVDCKLCR